MLFNTLSETFQGTPNAGVIDKLYQVWMQLCVWQRCFQSATLFKSRLQGGLHDFLHCHKCGTERVRKDAFSDLSLVRARACV